MRAIFGPFLGALKVACLAAALSAAPIHAVVAQTNPASAPKQMALSEKQIENVLAAKADIDPIIAKLPEGNEAPDAKTVAQLDGAAKKYGFANYADYSDVEDNISLVMAGIDPDTKKYVGDEIVLKKEIAGVQADKQMTPKDKKEAIAQLNEALKSIAPLQFPANIPLVVKYYDKLSEAAAPNQ